MKSTSTESGPWSIYDHIIYFLWVFPSTGYLRGFNWKCHVLNLKFCVQNVGFVNASSLLYSSTEINAEVLVEGRG